jgi:CBS domain-containing protein
MRTVRDVLKEKGNEMWTVSPDATVFEALQLMAERNIGAVMVLEGGALVGILSERDYARKVVLKGRMSKDTRARDIMTEHVLFARPDQSIEECMAVMTNKHIRHLPVFEADKLAGLISIGDVVKAIIEDQGFTIGQLTDYITGKTR